MDDPSHTLTRDQALREATQKLRSAGVETPRRDAERLLCRVLGISRTDLLAHPDWALEGSPDSGESDFGRFERAIERRARREPLAYILGRWPFFDFEVAVQPGVLVPRPETELLVEVTASLLGPEEPGRLRRVVDVGTGSGIIPIALLRLRTDLLVVATDRSSRAIAVARQNFLDNRRSFARNADSQAQSILTPAHPATASSRSSPLTDPPIDPSPLPSVDEPLLLEGELLAPVPPGWRSHVDAIVSNPPYIPSEEIDSLQPEISRWEPGEALDGGPDGLDVIRRIIADSRGWLAPGGLLALEIGLGQDQAVRDTMTAADYRRLRTFPDLAGIPRVLVGWDPDRIS